uniref:KRAB domain-containing protein n=1 Tax=Catharus ustulatus TaxID=91951 RepID=A0A8C3UGL4_CATUS
RNPSKESLHFCFLFLPTMEPYVVLDPRQRALYRDVMQESYETLMALGEEPSPSRRKLWGMRKGRGSNGNQLFHCFIVEESTKHSSYS